MGYELSTQEEREMLSRVFVLGKIYQILSCRKKLGWKELSGVSESIFIFRTYNPTEVVEILLFQKYIIVSVYEGVMRVY